MKKQITMRSLFMIVMFALMSFAGYSQVAVAVKQDSSIANIKRVRLQEDSIALGHLPRIRIRSDTAIANTKRVRASVDTVAAVDKRIRIRVDTTNAKLALIKTSTYLQKQKLDTLAQSMRANQNVGGFTKKIINTITTNTVAYSSGFNIGGINTITGASRTNAGTGSLLDLQIWSTETQTFNCTVDIWSASPSGTYTNNSAQRVNGDQAIWLGSISVAGTDFVSVGTGTAGITRAHIKNVNLDFGGQAAKNLFFTIVTTSTPQWTLGTSGLYVITGFKQD